MLSTVNHMTNATCSQVQENLFFCLCWVISIIVHAWLIHLENKNVETVLQTRTEEPGKFVLTFHFCNTFIFSFSLPLKIYCPLYMHCIIHTSLSSYTMLFYHQATLHRNLMHWLFLNTAFNNKLHEDCFQLLILP